MTLRHHVDVSSALPYMANRAKMYCTIGCDYNHSNTNHSMTPLVKIVANIADLSYLGQIATNGAIRCGHGPCHRNLYINLRMSSDVFLRGGRPSGLPESVWSSGDSFGSLCAAHEGRTCLPFHKKYRLNSRLVLRDDGPPNCRGQNKFNLFVKSLFD